MFRKFSGIHYRFARGDADSAWSAAFYNHTSLQQLQQRVMK
jgi:hypothetical protein